MLVRRHLVYLANTSDRLQLLVLVLHLEKTRQRRLADPIATLYQKPITDRTWMGDGQTRQESRSRPALDALIECINALVCRVGWFIDRMSNPDRNRELTFPLFKPPKGMLLLSLLSVVFIVRKATPFSYFQFHIFTEEALAAGEQAAQLSCV